MNVFYTLKERGFIEQVTDAEALSRLLENRTTCYIGFDPSASSFHVGSLIPIMAMAHLQKAGHRTIAVVGGGTGLIGDPSGKTEMRKILSGDIIRENLEGLKKQLIKFLDFQGGNALLLDNQEWLCSWKYIDFLREVGRHFSVNKMLAAETYRQRLETGLNFIEFNYMLLQAYDFLYLFQKYDCRLQLGGNDQWGNILAGADLIRRVEGAEAHGITFPLLTTTSGQKMGKTESGAVWLHGDLFSPYDYYQFWINCQDESVEKFLALFTMLPMEEVRELGSLKGADIRKAKEVLAYETTKILHGSEHALKARTASRSVFYGDGEDTDAIETSKMNATQFDQGIPAYVLFTDVKMCTSRSEARRLIAGGGAYINDRRIVNFDDPVTRDFIKDGKLLLRAGKKRYHLIVVS